MLKSLRGIELIESNEPQDKLIIKQELQVLKLILEKHVEIDRIREILSDDDKIFYDLDIYNDSIYDEADLLTQEEWDLIIGVIFDV